MQTCLSCDGLTPDGALRCLHCDALLRTPPRWARRLSALLGPAGAILLAACYGAPGRFRVHDTTDYAGGSVYRADGDRDGTQGPYLCRRGEGQCAEELAQMPVATEVDCDDANPARFPGAADVDGDGVDSNCDGVDGWADPATVAVPPPP